MGRTIGRKWPRRRGIYTDTCDYCGVQFHSDKLVRLPNGLLACRDNDAIGRTETELDEGNARASAQIRPRQGRRMDR